MESYYLIRTDQEGETHIAKHTRESLLELLNAIGEYSETHGNTWFVSEEEMSGAFSGVMTKDLMMVIRGEVVRPEVTNVAIAYDLPRKAKKCS